MGGGKTSCSFCGNSMNKEKKVKMSREMYKYLNDLGLMNNRANSHAGDPQH